MDRRGAWTRGAILLLGGIALLLGGLGAADLFNPDEPREAEMAREMLTGGGLVAPRLNGEPFLEKPPLFYWLVVGVYRAAGGPSEAAARLVPALAGLLIVLIVFAAGRRMIGDDGALVAAAALLTAGGFLWTSRRCMIDIPLSLAVLLACLCLHRGIVTPTPRRGVWLLAGYASTAAAVLFKGIIGAGIPALAVFGYLLAGPGQRGSTGPDDRRGLTDAVRAIAGRVVRSWAVPGFALALAPAGIWAWLLGRRLGPGAAREFVWVNNVLRFIGGAEGKGHEQPFHYYAPTLIVEFMPWSLILPAAIAAAGIAARRAGRDAAPAGRPDAADGDRRGTLRYLLAWFCVPIVVLSIASTKRGIYLLPIYPAAALLIGWYVSRPAGKGAGRAGRVALGFLFAGTLLIVAGTVVAQTWVGWRPAIGVPFVLVALLAVPIALRALQDGRAVRCALLCATLAGAAFLVVVTHLVPVVVGRAASARPIAAAVRDHADQGDRLAFYDFPQGQMGGILFYAGLTLPNLRTPEEVDRFLAGDGGAFVLMREYDRDSVIPRLAVPVVVARRFDPSIQTPRRRPGGAILMLARAGIEDNAAGATGRTPP